MIEIRKPGLYTSLQDLGRYNCSHLGVPVSGSMDSICAADANRLLSNNPTASVLECTIVGPEILFHQKTAIAITGSVVQPFINGLPSYINTVVSVESGDILSFGKIVVGTRFYIAISGGFQGPQILNSQSVCITSSILNLVKKGDYIPHADFNDALEKISFPLRKVGNKKITVKTGPEFGLIKQFNPNIEDALHTSYMIRQESNRMAYRVSHNLNLLHNQSIISSGTMPGTVQLTPSGEIIFLMRDAQTTGGYPRILQLTEVGICDLAQMKAGEKFQLVCIE